MTAARMLGPDDLYELHEMVDAVAGAPIGKTSAYAWFNARRLARQLEAKIAEDGARLYALVAREVSHLNVGPFMSLADVAKFGRKHIQHDLRNDGLAPEHMAYLDDADAAVADVESWSIAEVLVQLAECWTVLPLSSPVTTPARALEGDLPDGV